MSELEKALEYTEVAFKHLFVEYMHSKEFQYNSVENKTSLEECKRHLIKAMNLIRRELNKQ